MDKRPKRRKYRDNPYELISSGKKYFVKFKDSSNQIKVVEVSEVIYKTFDNFELDDLSFLNEYDRHIEHSEVFENTIHNRLVDKPMELEDYVIQKTTFEELHNAIKCLPEIQQRRIKKYYFDDKNVYEIAEEENTTHQAISKSIKIALKKLNIILKK